MGKNCFTPQQMKDIIEGKRGGDRIPMVFNFWSNPENFKENKARAMALMREFPYDIQDIQVNMPTPNEAPEDEPQYQWLYRSKDVKHSGGLDSNVYIEDYETELDDILAHFPSADSPHLIPQDVEETGKYRLVWWWYGLFERLWSLRGMENALTDFYLYPDEVHRLFQRLTDFYMRVMERAREELHADAIFTSDDIGMQTSTFFSVEIFEQFFKPYYRQLIDKAHALGMHFWLHSCGNIRDFIPHLIELGLDVLHPIQKYTMDEAEIAQKFGDQICIWAGFDVQRIIPYGTAADVRREVRFMIDTYARKNGRLMLTCGNGLTEDCTIESFEALLSESYFYGREKMRAFR